MMYLTKLRFFGEMRQLLFIFQGIPRVEEEYDNGKRKDAEDLESNCVRRRLSGEKPRRSSSSGGPGAVVRASVNHFSSRFSPSTFPSPPKATVKTV